MPLRLALAVGALAAVLSAPLSHAGEAVQQVAAIPGDFGTDTRAMSVIDQQMVAEPTQVTLSLLNQYRAARGLGALAIDAQMTVVAYQQAKAMADADFMDHNVVGDFGHRLIANKVVNVYAGENIGRNIRTAEKMFDWWVHSPVHESNMSNPRMTRLGFAVVYSAKSGKPYWAMALASAPIQ
ncbi:MAG: CAP domain-containing protein [Micropepsaceae bacterium]